MSSAFPSAHLQGTRWALPQSVVAYDPGAGGADLRGRGATWPAVGFFLVFGGEK